MLKNFIIHQKNVIFLKFFACCLGVFIIFWFLQLLNTDYIKSIIRNSLTEESLAQETLKLYSLTKSKHKILETYSRYSKLLANSSSQNCLARRELTTNIGHLSGKYNLNEPITVLIKQDLLSGIESTIGTRRDSIRIRNYDVKIMFATKNYATFLKIINEIYSLMPKNTVIISVEVKRENVLEPKVVYKLSTQRMPDMIFTKINLLLREVTVIK